jgi:hypothetical protein
MLIRPHKNNQLKQYVQKKLIVRLRIFVVLFFILFSVLCYEIGMGYISFLLSFSALLVGAASGLFFVRRKKIYWEEESARVIWRMDKIGVVLLIIYILFAILRHWLLHAWLEGNMLTAFTISFATGAMMARVWSMRRKILKVLKEQDII